MTAYEMLISDWSSYVCSSDLFTNLDEPLLRMRLAQDFYARRGYRKAVGEFQVYVHGIWRLDGLSWRLALDRKSVVSGKRVSVRVDVGGRRRIKKKNKNKQSI